MNKRILATMTILSLLMGALAIVNFNVNAQPPTNYYLTCLTNPVGIYSFAEQGWYPEGSYINVTAEMELSGPPGVRYKFNSWTGDVYSIHTSPNGIWVHMTANKTVTANYDTEYLFTVYYPYSASWLESFTASIWSQNASNFVPGSGASGVYSAWLPKDTLVQAGIKRSDGGTWMGVPWIYGSHGRECVVFVNWTGLGFYVAGDGHAWSNPNMIKMTGPRSATVEWKYWYFLEVTSDQLPEPAGEGWYAKNTNVQLTANKIVVNWAREWRLDHWEVDGVSRGQDVNPITVYMNTNHTASAFYKCWVFLWLDDDIGNMSGIKDNGKWYKEGVPYYFTAPNPVPIDSTHRYGFKYWFKVGSAWTNTSNPVCIIFDATWAGYTLRAIYHMQYYLTITTDPLGVTAIPGSGWYDAGTIINPGPTAPDTVNIVAGQSRWKFDQWVRTVPPGWSTTANTIPSITMDQPKTFVAYYHKEYKREWYQSPTSISVPGFPSSDWQTDGALIWWAAPATDVSTNFVFLEWDIDGTVYPQGQTNVLILHNHYIVGTAYYANKTKVFMDPSYHGEVAHAYCNRFDVGVYATNFDTYRNVSGEPMDIYAIDIGIKWDGTLIELESVTLNLEDFFDDYPVFVGINQISIGYYRLVATVQGPYQGFSGTKLLLTMRFHVIYDPCFPNSGNTWIEFDPLHRQLSNHLGHPIAPELGWKDCYYTITTVKPIVELIDPSDGDNTIVVHQMVPDSFFDVWVYLHHGVKVTDFDITINYNKAQIKAVDVFLGDYLQPPFILELVQINHAGGWVRVAYTQDPTVPLRNCSGLLFTIRFKVILGTFYTLGPHGLTSPISINPALISVRCPAPAIQSLANGNLGKIDATYVYNPLPGDLDFDGEVTVLDLQLVMSKYGTVPNPNPGGPYDVTYNGITDLYDLVFVALHIPPA